MSSIGTDAAEHRATCKTIVQVEYSVPDLLPMGSEQYPGPTSKPGHRAMIRVWWHSGLLALASKAPTSGADVHELGRQIGEAAALQMFRDPLGTMLIPLLDQA